MSRLILLVAVAAAVAGCAGESDEVVAHVGKQTITKEQLERTVEHFGEEAKREGKPFPKEGSPGFDDAQDRLLALLVYRAELADQAESIGLKLDDEVVERRLEAGGSTEEGEDAEGKAFARESVRAQLYYEAIYRKVTAKESGSSPEAAAKRNTVAERFIARMKQDYANKIRYEPGYAPGS
jgi:replicative superfamily II helicase